MSARKARPRSAHVNLLAGPAASITGSDAGSINGACESPIDPNLTAPKFAEHGAQVVIAGGGDSAILRGIGKYANRTGTFPNRVFVGFGAPGSGAGGTGIVYYDELWFSGAGGASDLHCVRYRDIEPFAP